MTTRTKFVVTTLVVTTILMALHPITPLGATIWPDNSAAGQPPAWSLPLFLLLFIAEAAVSAIGVAFLFFGWGFTRHVMRDRPRLAPALHASVSFLFIQWWPHGNLHMSVPFSFVSILAIDYVFHIPIMVASLIVLVSLVHVGRRAAVEAAAAEPAPGRPSSNPVRLPEEGA